MSEHKGKPKKLEPFVIPDNLKEPTNDHTKGGDGKHSKGGKK